MEALADAVERTPTRKPRPKGQPLALEPGQDLLHYRLVETLGAGGMGVVYRAHDSKLRRDVAIKVLPDNFAADPERLTRFEREAHVLASLNHAGIASIYGLEEASGIQSRVHLVQNWFQELERLVP